MKPDVVVDVGNTRIKWAMCADPITQVAALPHGDPTAWAAQLEAWQLTRPLSWAVTGVQPTQRDHLIDWLRSQGHAVLLVDDPKLLPVRVAVPNPAGVGIDRLFDAVAANARMKKARKKPAPVVIIDAGTAVTVNLLSPDGVFEGGAIMPGRRLMAAALHEHTALLPMIAGKQVNPPPVGIDTPAAIEAGIHHAVSGGINQLIAYQVNAKYPRAAGHRAPTIFLTGGDGPLLHPAVDSRAELWPAMTLEGIRLTAEAQP